MSGRYFLAWVTALAGLMAAQSSSALTVFLDGVAHPNVTKVTISEGDSSTPPPGDSNPPPGDSNPPPGDSNPPPGDSNPPPGGGICNNSQLALFQERLPTSKGTYNFRRGEAYAFSFSGQAGTRGRISYVETVAHGYGYTSKLMVISECAGDLNTAGLDRACYDNSSSGTIMLSFNAVEPSTRYCTLAPGKTYYATIRNSYAAYGKPEDDSCPQGTLCGFTLNTSRF